LQQPQKRVAGDLLKREFLNAYSGLFCKQEADYLSFYYDNSKFVNAMALRNGYEHGYFDGLTEEQHKTNYYIGLMLLGIVTIKINDDLCQKFAK
jgi:hypothetical protein